MKAGRKRRMKNRGREKRRRGKMKGEKNRRERNKEKKRNLILQTSSNRLISQQLSVSPDV